MGSVVRVARVASGLPLALAIAGSGCGKVVKISFDSGPSCVGLSPQALPGPASAVWVDGAYSLTSTQTVAGNPDIYFERLDPGGASLGAPVRVTTDPGASRVLSLVAIDGGYAVLWDDDRAASDVHQLFVAPLDPTGAESTGAETPIGDIFGSELASADKTSAILVWSGNELATAWLEDRDIDGNPEVYFARLAPDGTKIVDLRVNTAAAPARDVTITRLPNGYGLAWSDDRSALGDGNSEIYFARLDDQGNRVAADDQRVTTAPGFSVRPALAFDGSDFGVAWADNRTGNSEIFFRRLDAAGVTLGDEVQVTDDPSPVDTKDTPGLTWNGSEFALSWSDARSGNDEVYLARLDADGNRLGDDVQVSHSDTDSLATGLLATGATYSLIWEEASGGGARDGFLAAVCPTQ